MGSFGMEPCIDPAGNIFGSRAGSNKNLKPILFGSHTDSVSNGGNFDGDLGSMAAIEVLHTLKEHSITTRHPLQMVIWTNEEYGFTGSRAAAGDLQPGDLKRVYDGILMPDGVRKLGGDPTRLAEARLLPGAFRCYLELHIEQGDISLEGDLVAALDLRTKLIDSHPLAYLWSTYGQRLFFGQSEAGQTVDPAALLIGTMWRSVALRTMLEPLLWPNDAMRCLLQRN
jgi:acetylornithine deacetylase/succinyl-diaminopimelate desuccinylase-like protein